MNELMEFSIREEFREWLHINCLTSSGVWLLFGKPGGPKTISAGSYRGADNFSICFAERA